jgi:hypothetical protein
MHADRSSAIGRRNGTREATTLRKLPMASPGAVAAAASARFTVLSSASRAPRLSVYPVKFSGGVRSQPTIVTLGNPNGTLTSGGR